MSKPKIFITQPIAESASQRLKAVMDVEIHPDSSRPISKEDLIKGVRKNDYLFIRLSDTVDAEIMDANSNLKLIATMASTPGAIDVEAANHRKIPLTGRKTQTIDTIFEEVADLALGLMIAVARRLPEAQEVARTGIFPGDQSPYLEGFLVYTKTLGIVGMGKVGEALSRRASGFRMKILYHDVMQFPEIENRLGVQYVTLEELLRESDFVSLHPKLNPETHHMIGEKELSLMKADSFLINTSRGSIVDQDALIRALQSKKIAGAALDVFEDERHPLPKELLDLKNVVLTPHIGSSVIQKREIMANAVVDKILAFNEGKPLPDLLNPEIYKK